MPTSSDLESDALDALIERVRGAVITETASIYDDARSVWNGLIDNHPVAIVRCSGPADVMAGLDFAKAIDRHVSVKGGGHLTTGEAVRDDGVVLDLSPMNGVRVDPDSQTVRVGGGATWGDVYHETVPFGLVPPGGFDDEVGVGGFTLGGGQGVTVRSEGMACDCLLEVDIVTADGELITASEDQHADLFWALRGGGAAGFGVVTSFVFECFPLPFDLATTTAYYRLSDGPTVFRHLREHMVGLPEAVLPTVGIAPIPDLPDIPQQVAGSHGIYLYLLYAGDPENASMAFDPLLDAGDPLVVNDAIMPITETFGPSPAGRRRHWESLFLKELPDDLIDTLFEKGPNAPSHSISLFGFGDLSGHNGSMDTAYAHRDCPYQLMIAADWDDPADDASNRKWVRQMHKRLAPYATGEYINLQTDTDRDRAAGAFGDNRNRLAEIKARWDPHGIFGFFNL